MIYLYAVAEGVGELPPVPGVEGATLEHRRVDGLDLVVSEVSTALEPTEASVLAHARVVEALLPRTDALLPARFGRGFADERLLEAAVRDRAETLRDGLDRVRGCVELGLRVVGEAHAPARAATSGRAYMEGRLATAMDAKKLANQLHDELAALARASVSEIATTPRFVLSSAYLVEEDQVESLRSRVAGLEKLQTTLSFACTGPWPPYSFAGASP
jgi:gas vesicle protein GvpL/GvpF